MYKILSIDGGGIYGAFFASQLMKLETLHPGFLDEIDLVAGTSIGGIIALAVADEMEMDKIIEIFSKEAGGIFHNSYLRKILRIIGLKAKYNNKNLKKVLEEKFKDRALYDLKKKVVIPSFQIKADGQWQEKVFHNFDRIGGCPYPNIQKASMGESIVNVALATSAAPTFFPAYDVYIDGAVAQNNPAMQALAFTQDDNFWGDTSPKLEEIKIFSIGCNYSGDEIQRSSMDWGYLRWIKYIFKILIRGNMVSSDYQCRQLLGHENYFRYCANLPLELSKELDSTELIQDLIEFDDCKQLARANEWIAKNWFD